MMKKASGGDEDNSDLLQKGHAHTAALSAPDPAADPCRSTSTRDSWTLPGSLGQSLVGTLFLSPVSWCAQGFVCAPQESISLCKLVL